MVFSDVVYHNVEQTICRKLHDYVPQCHITRHN